MAWVYRPSMFVLSLLLSGGAAVAQDLQRIAPKELPANPEVRELQPPPVSPSLPKDDHVIIPALKGLVFVGGAEQIVRGGASATGIDTARIDVLDADDFRGLIAPYLGQPLTLNRLNDIVKQTVVFYREHDRPLVDVVVPEQDITNGTVQIVVMEFRAGAIRTDGNTWFSDELLLSGLHVRTGDRISGESLLDDVNALNQNPFRRVDLVYQRSDQPGRSDIILRTVDRLPFRAYSGFENSGTTTTGRNRLMAGFNWGNVFGLGHIFNYQATGSTDILPWESYSTAEGRPNLPRYQAHSGSYIAPLPWGHQINFFGAYAKTVPTLSDSFNLVGESWQVGGRYSVPLPRVDRYQHTIAVGGDFKRTNNNLDFGGTQIYGSHIDVAQGAVDYSGSLPDSWGITGLSVNLALSPGGVTSGNTRRAYTADGGRAGSRADYLYGRLGLDRQITLPADFGISLRYQMQVSSTALQSSEQFGLGGATTVRGYSERAANGDRGWLFNGELQLPAFSPGDIVTASQDVGDQLRFHVFVDVGRVSNLKEIAGQPRATTLASVGGGFRYALQPYVSATLDYGAQLREAPTGTTRNGMLHLAIVLGL